ncbi:MAG: 5-formyltetrahydrofolate cyclo-ligase [Pseudonocardia sp.]|nr:5-formyltetrahydrofolate cyclo-ligase [Pseudonocardia sp.]
MTARGEDGAAHANVAKDEWRRRTRAARRALTPVVRSDRAAALTTAALDLANGVTGPICAYLPIGTEPGSPGLVEALRAAGHEVLLPVVSDSRGPLEWARFDTDLAPGPIGLREPVGPRLGPAAIGRAALVLVPALAADRGGGRLGKGGGYYDRTLPLATPGTPLVVVLNDEELVHEVPTEPHDHRVTAALLPGAGLVPLGNSS